MKLLVYILALASVHLVAAGQELNEDLLPGPSPGVINFGFDKLENTYLFRTDADINLGIFGGTFRIAQNYRGTAIQTSDKSYRDDENLRMRFDKNIYGPLSFVFTENFVYYSDSRLGDINNLGRLNGLTGLKYTFKNESYIEAKAGLENYSSPALNTLGSSINIAALAAPGEIAGVNVSGSALGQFLNLGESRNIDRIRLNVGASRNYSPTERIGLDLRYKSFDRDFYAQSGIAGLGYILQNRYENSIDGRAGIDYSLTDDLIAGLNLDFSNSYVDRSYPQPYEELKDSRIAKYFNDLRLGINFKINYNTKKFKQNLGVLYNISDKDHNVRKNGDISEPDFALKVAEENRLDYYSSFSGVAGTTEISLSPCDTLKLIYSLNLYRYDSPSDYVNDDRDEFTGAFAFYYSRAFSRLITAGIYLEANLDHLVYIKRQMSASNNWKRILRFSPFIYAKYGNFSMKPVLEALANYTVYDFENLTANVASQSFRQISYRDSLIYRFSNEISLASRLFFRYYEEGDLFWNNFSESPRSGNTEQLATLMLSYEIKDFTAGFGGRYYNRSVQSLSNVKTVPFSLYDVFSISPEALIKFNIFDRTVISVNGWYEFRWKNKEMQATPNLFINSSVRI